MGLGMNGGVTAVMVVVGFAEVTCEAEIFLYLRVLNGPLEMEVCCWSFLTPFY